MSATGFGVNAASAHSQRGVTLAAGDHADQPTAFWARTVQACRFFDVSFVTTTDVAATVTTLAAAPERLHENWYAVIVAPFAVGAVTVTLAEALNAASRGAAGVDGVFGVVTERVADQSDQPTPFRALILQA